MRIFYIEARQPVTVDNHMPIKRFVVPADSYEDAIKKTRERHPGYLHIYVCEPMYPGDDAQQNYICCQKCPLLDPMRENHCITSSPDAAEYILGLDGLCPAGKRPIWEPIEEDDDVVPRAKVDSEIKMWQNLYADTVSNWEKAYEDLELKLVGVMWSVDKWLEGDELNQDEVNRAATMREKTLRIVEGLQAEVELERANSQSWENLYNHDVKELSDNLSMVIEKLESAETEGEWEKRVFIIFDSEKVGYRCSECNTTWDVATKHCPNCGIKMKGGDTE